MRHPAWWLLAAMVAGAAWALDPPRPAPAPAPGPEQSGQAEQAPAEPPVAVDAAPVPAAEDGPPPASPTGTRSTGPTPQRFDPSEKVRADFPVSFPIDI